MCQLAKYNHDHLAMLLSRELAHSLACHSSALQFLNLRSSLLGTGISVLAQVCHVDTKLMRCARAMWSSPNMLSLIVRPKFSSMR